MNVSFIDFKREWSRYEQAFVQAFRDFGARGQYVLGPAVEELETKFAALHGYRFGVAINTGLSALEVALYAHGIGHGDEVITVPNSAVATALAISRVGATPVFCDIGDDFLIDVSQIESLLTSKTKAILPVHLFGKICDMASISAIAKKHNLAIIEDACQAHGAAFVGASAVHTKAFSFYPTKNLGAMGEGGLIMTNDPAVRDFSSQYRNYGQNGRYNHEIKGMNYRINSLQCALLLVKLPEFSASIDRRRAIAEAYVRALGNLPGLTVSTFDPSSSYHLFVVRVNGGKRNALQAHLKERGVETLIHYPIAIHRQPCYREEYIDVHFPKTETFQEEILSLPCYPFLTDEEVAYTIEVVKEFFV